MSEWQTMTLQDAGVTLIDCVHKTPAFAIDGYPYITIPQMKNGRIDFSAARRISPEDFNEWTKKARPQLHDVVLSRRTNPGVTATFGERCDFAVGQNLVLLRADGRIVRPEFLRWLVVSPAWWSQIEKYNNVGAIFDSLRCGDVPRFELPIPPKREQEAISSILGALDDKIELNRSTNETLEAMARAMFRDWFVDFGPTRAKMVRDVPYLAANLWSIFPDAFDVDERPVGWKIGDLDQVAEIRMGASPDGSTYNAEGVGVPLVNGPVEFGEFFLRRIKWTTAPTRMSKAGDLILCVRGSTTGRLAFADGEYCLGRGVAAIRGRDDLQEFVDGSVLEHLEDLLRCTTGSVFPNLSAADICGLPVIVPDRRIIEAFCETVRPIRQRVWANVNESATLAEIRDVLLPKLISGEIRIRDAEKIAQEAA